MTVCTVHVMSYTDSVNTSWHIQQGQCTEHDTLSKDSTHNKTHSSRTVHRAWHTPHGQHTLFKDSAQSMTHSPRTAHTTWHTLQGQWTEHDTPRTAHTTWHTLQGQCTEHDTLQEQHTTWHTLQGQCTEHDTPLSMDRPNNENTQNRTVYKAWHTLQGQWVQSMTRPTMTVFTDHDLSYSFLWCIQRMIYSRKLWTSW
jgi:hypothetical protein